MIRFLNDTNGNFGLTAALCFPVVLIGAGLAIDTATLVSARATLQQNADAAVLAAAREKRVTVEREKLFEASLKAGVGASLKLADFKLAVDEGLDYVKVTGTASADVDLHVLGGFGAKRVSVEATAQQSTQSLLVSLVLDNTGSMEQAGIDALKRAAHSLVDTVELNANGRQDIHLSVVPFVTAVNINGEGFKEAWIDKDGQALYNGWNFLDASLQARRKQGERLTQLPDDYADQINGPIQACKNQGEGQPAIEKRENCAALAAAKAYPHQMKLFELSGTEWKGCVEARPEPYNMSLTAPTRSNPDTLFVPYFAPDEPGTATWAHGNDANNFNNSWLDDVVSGADDRVQRSTLKYVDPQNKLVEQQKSLTRGPNRACPTPITPLTSDLGKIRSAINAMKFWNGSGTNISEGLAWGWRVLSPSEPYAQSASIASRNAARHLVLMTDGRNVAFGARNKHNGSDYGSYGFLSSGRVGQTKDQGTVEGILNGWTLKMCDDIKAQDIQIHTVVYKEKDKGVHDMLRNCASRPANFHLTENTSQLEAAFSKIGTAMSALRLTN
jgi:Flp pilus assembly protein TadG